MPQTVSLFDVEPILETLQSGDLLLTSNQRLASRIRNACTIACQQRGSGVIRTPRVYALKSWIDSQWQQLLAAGYPEALRLRVLEPHQELYLWEQIVSRSAVGQGLLRPAATARQAMNAWRLLVEWQLAVDDQRLLSQLAGDEDAQLWQQWALDFEQHCSDHALMSAHRIPDILAAAYRQGFLAPEEHITLVGFIDMTPLHRHLLDAVGPSQALASTRPAGAVTCVQCESPQQEIQAAAVWAKQVLKHEPQARVAIVVPELSQRRAGIERIVLEVFEPGYNLVTVTAAEQGGSPGVRGAERRALPFNVSAGYPLGDAPLVRTALDVLALASPELSLDTLQGLLHSPFLAIGSGETDAVAQLVTRCRAARSDPLNSAQVRQWAAAITTSGEVGDWRFARALQESVTLLRRLQAGTAKSCEQWCALFEQQLALFGWPGDRQLDSIEYQQHVQWQQVLQQFTNLQLAASGLPLSFGEALSQLSGLLSNHIFQPQTADSSLQVLGTLEASGLQFSHLWLTSMSARDWPPAPTPNPLLPLALQKSLAMPHCDAAREHAYAHQLSQLFVRSADTVVVSAPAVIDDNPTLLSRLFSAWPQVPLRQVLGRELAGLLPMLEVRRRHFESRRLERFEPGSAPPLSEGDSVRGGVAIFTDQSACPFRAFAKHRLATDALQEPELGLSAADRGNILHRALELFWNSVGSQQALLSLSAEALAERCYQSSQYAVSQYCARAGKALGERFRALETDRLAALLTSWLEREAQRPPFQVQETEQRWPFTFAGLACETRIDRVDRLADDSLLIIDYKTGNASPGDWWGERPDQPQLPLYVLVTENNKPQTRVEGIAFAQVMTRNMELKGAGDEACAETAIRWSTKHKNDSGFYTWQQQKQEWHRVLSRLAEDFRSGCAEVDPKYAPRQSGQTCRYCHLQAACRVGHEELQS